MPQNETNVNETNVNETNTTVENLKELIQNYREKARRVLRALFISNKLQEIFYTRQSIKDQSNRIKDSEKWLEKQEENVKITEYDLSKIDPADPQAEKKTEDLTKRLETNKKKVEEAKNNLEITKKTVEREIKRLKEEEKQYNEKIKEMEKGEIKVDIESVKEYTDKMIKQDLMQ
jgi:predicted RND superfamily exporter protein